MRGEKGDPGPVGPPGLPGEKGARGRRGKRVTFYNSKKKDLSMDPHHVNTIEKCN